jgi:hypothetical protein
MPVSIRGTAGGSVTLSSGAAAADTTLTLPNTTGPVALTASPTFSGTLTATTITSPASTALTIQSAGTTAMTVNTSQNVGIGTSSPNTRLQVYKAASSTFTGTALGALVITDSSSTANYYSSIDFNIDSYTTKPIARIAVQSTGGGSYLVFGTSTSYASGITTTGMIIDPSGNVLVNTTSVTGKFNSVGGSSIGGYFTSTGSHGVLGTSSSGYGLYGQQTGTVSGGVIGYDNVNGIFGICGYAGYAFYGNGSIYVNGTIYTSDARLKENVLPITNSLAKINALNPVSFNWKAKSSRGFASDFGLIAQEVEQIIPECVFEAKSPPRTLEMTHEMTLEEELGSHKGVDYSRFIPFLIAACQELSAKNDALESRLAALEAK